MRVRLRQKTTVSWSLNHPSSSTSTADSVCSGDTTAADEVIFLPEGCSFFWKKYGMKWPICLGHDCSGVTVPAKKKSVDLLGFADDLFYHVLSKIFPSLGSRRHARLGRRGLPPSLRRSWIPSLSVGAFRLSCFHVSFDTQWNVKPSNRCFFLGALIIWDMFKIGFWFQTYGV